jgi:hypothetical protein
MGDINQTIHELNSFVEREGVKELHRRSGVPYTTLLGWHAQGFRPPAVATFERLAAVVKPEPASEDEAV